MSEELFFIFYFIYFSNRTAASVKRLGSSVQGNTPNQGNKPNTVKKSRIRTLVTEQSRDQNDLLYNYNNGISVRLNAVLAGNEANEPISCSQRIFSSHNPNREGVSANASDITMASDERLAPEHSASVGLNLDDINLLDDINWNLDVD